MNWPTFFPCYKPFERGLNHCLMLVGFIWLVSGYDSMTDVLFEMSEDGEQQSAIKESGSVSKAKTQLSLSGMDLKSGPWKPSNLETTFQHPLVGKSDDMSPEGLDILHHVEKTAIPYQENDKSRTTLQKEGGVSADHSRPGSFHKEGPGSVRVAHQEGPVSPADPLEEGLVSKDGLASDVGTEEFPAVPIDENLQNTVVEHTIVKRSIREETNKGTFYTIEGSNSTTATYSTTSIAPFYFLNPRVQLDEDNGNDVDDEAQHVGMADKNNSMDEDTENVTRRTKPIFKCHAPKWQFYMKLVCVTVLTVAGLIGNTLSFCVLCSPVYSRKSYSYYLRALAIFDSLTLIITAILTWNEGYYAWSKLSLKRNPQYEITFIQETVIQSVNGTNVSTIVNQAVNTTKTAMGFLDYHSDFTCKLSNYFRNVVYIMSSWLVVCFTLDRYIAVRHPLQRSRLCTERRAKVVIVCVFLFALVSNIYQLVYMEKLDRSSHNKCHAPKSKRVEFFAIDYFMFSFLLRFFIPFLIICIFNGRIIFHIQHMKNIRKDPKEPWNPSFSSTGNSQLHSTNTIATTLTTSNTASAAKRSNQAITTLYTVCLVFIITLSPNAIITAIQFIQYHTERSPDLLCNLLKAEVPLQMVRLSNYAINFIIYGFTGRQFRRELLRLLKRKRNWSESNGYQAFQMRAQEMMVIRNKSR